MSFASVSDIAVAFQSLGISPTLDQAAIKRAYRVSTMKIHPDLFQAEAEKRRAHETFIKLAQARDAALDAAGSPELIDWLAAQARPRASQAASQYGAATAPQAERGHQPGPGGSTRSEAGRRPAGTPTPHSEDGSTTSADTSGAGPFAQQQRASATEGTRASDDHTRPRAEEAPRASGGAAGDTGGGTTSETSGGSDTVRGQRWSYSGTTGRTEPPPRERSQGSRRPTAYEEEWRVFAADEDAYFRLMESASATVSVFLRAFALSTALSLRLGLMAFLCLPLVAIVIVLLVAFFSASIAIPILGWIVGIAMIGAIGGGLSYLWEASNRSLDRGAVGMLKAVARTGYPTRSFAFAFVFSLAVIAAPTVYLYSQGVIWAAVLLTILCIAMATTLAIVQGKIESLLRELDEAFARIRASKGYALVRAVPDSRRPAVSGAHPRSASRGAVARSAAGDGRGAGAQAPPRTSTGTTRTAAGTTTSAKPDGDAGRSSSEEAWADSHKRDERGSRMDPPNSNPSAGTAPGRATASAKPGSGPCPSCGRQFASTLLRAFCPSCGQELRAASAGWAAVLIRQACPSAPGGGATSSASDSSPPPTKTSPGQWETGGQQAKPFPSPSATSAGERTAAASVPGTPERVFLDLTLDATGRNSVVELAPYHPYDRGQNPSFDEHSRRILRLKDGERSAIDHFFHQLDPMLGRSFVITVVPGHDSGSVGGIRELGHRLAVHGRLDGTDVLRRHTPIQKLSSGGNRGIDVHLRTVSISNQALVRGRDVLLIDDVTSTGNSFKACKSLLTGAGARSVSCLALGKTTRIPARQTSPVTPTTSHSRHEAPPGFRESDRIFWEPVLDAVAGLGSSDCDVRAASAMRISWRILSAPERSYVLRAALEKIARLSDDSEQSALLSILVEKGWQGLDGLPEKPAVAATDWPKSVKRSLPPLADSQPPAQSLSPAVDRGLGLSSDSPSEWLRAALAQRESGGAQPVSGQEACRYWASLQDWAQCLRLGSEAALATQRLIEAGAIPRSEPACALLAGHHVGNVEPPSIETALRLVDSNAAWGPLLVSMFEGSDDPRAADSLAKLWFGTSRSVLQWRQHGEALDLLGWLPNDDFEGAAYWIGKLRWSECERIGEPALEALRIVLEDRTVVCRAQICDTIASIGGGLPTNLTERESRAPEEPGRRPSATNQGAACLRRFPDRTPGTETERLAEVATSSAAEQESEEASGTDRAQDELRRRFYDEEERFNTAIRGLREATRRPAAALELTALVDTWISRGDCRRARKALEEARDWLTNFSYASLNEPVDSAGPTLRVFLAGEIGRCRKIEEQQVGQRRVEKQQVGQRRVRQRGQSDQRTGGEDTAWQVTWNAEK